MDWQTPALDCIKRFEGCRLVAYPDPGTGGDPWTIGWGSTGPGIKRGVRWTQEQADAALLEHVEAVGRDVDACVRVPIASHQKAGLVSLAYNIGTGALRKSTLLRLLNEGDYKGAAGQFGRWNRAGGRVLPGLTKRRAAERALFEGA